MEAVVLVIHLILAVALIGVILLQRTAQDGGGLVGGGGSSTMGGLFTARGSANLLTRTTAILATLFIATSLLLAILAGHRRDTGNANSLLTQPVTQQAPIQVPAAPVEKPATPQVPLGQ